MDDERIYISQGLFLTMVRRLASDTVKELIESGEIARITADTLRSMKDSGQLRSIVLDAMR